MNLALPYAEQIEKNGQLPLSKQAVVFEAEITVKLQAFVT